LTNNKLKY